MVLFYTVIRTYKKKLCVCLCVLGVVDGYLYAGDDVCMHAVCMGVYLYISMWGKLRLTQVSVEISQHIQFLFVLCQFGGGKSCWWLIFQVISYFVGYLKTLKVTRLEWLWSPFLPESSKIWILIVIVLKYGSLTAGNVVLLCGVQSTQVREVRLLRCWITGRIPNSDVTAGIFHQLPVSNIYCDITRGVARRSTTFPCNKVCN